MRTKQFWVATAGVLALSPIARTEESKSAVDPTDFTNYWDAASWDREGGSRFWHLAAPAKKPMVPKTTRNRAPVPSTRPARRPANSYQTPVVPTNRSR